MAPKMPRRLPIRRLAVIASLGASVAAAEACSADGATAVCPELPLYNGRADGARTPEILEKEAEAADAGCITARGDATSGGPSEGGGGD